MRFTKDGVLLLYISCIPPPPLTFRVFSGVSYMGKQDSALCSGFMLLSDSGGKVTGNGMVRCAQASCY